MSIGIIRISRPLRAFRSQPIPASIAPVLVTTARNPPITRTKTATSIALAVPVSGLYRPAMGAIRTAIGPCGLGATVWKVPGTGASLPSVGFKARSYSPAGMSQVSAAMTTISMKRMVKAVGNFLVIGSLTFPRWARHPGLMRQKIMVLPKFTWPTANRAPRKSWCRSRSCLRSAHRSRRKSRCAPRTHHLKDRYPSNEDRT